MNRTHLDLFSGVGGFAIAAKVNNVETLAFCEINDECSGFLERTYGRTVHRDIKAIDFNYYRGVWIITGGPPCQPVSVAGKRRGANDDRWLWPQAIKSVEVCKPAWFLFENPPGIKSLGLDGVLADLEALGYEVQTLNIPACAVDSPQRRERLWIVGHSKSQLRGLSIQPGRQEQASAKPSGAIKSGTVADSTEPGLQGSDAGVLQRAFGSASKRPEGSVMADSKRGAGVGRTDMQERGPEGGTAVGRDDQGVYWSDYQFIQCHDNKIRRCPTGLYEMVDGLSSKLLAALGNSIVWPIAAEIISAMIQAEEV